MKSLHCTATFFFLFGILCVLSYSQDIKEYEESESSLDVQERIKRQVSPNRGQGSSNSGQTPPYGRQRSPNGAPGPSNAGQVPPYGRQRSPNGAPGPSRAGQVPRNGRQRPINGGQGPSNGGQGPSNGRQRPPNRGLRPPNRGLRPPISMRLDDRVVRNQVAIMPMQVGNVNAIQALPDLRQLPQLRNGIDEVDRPSRNRRRPGVH